MNNVAEKHVKDQELKQHLWREGAWGQNSSTLAGKLKFDRRCLRFYIDSTTSNFETSGVVFRNKTTQKIKDRSKSLFSEWHWSGFFEADHNLAFFFFSTFQVDLRPGRASFGIVPQISESLGPVCHSNVFQPNLEANNDETFWDETNLCNFEIMIQCVGSPRCVETKLNWICVSRLRQEGSKV